MIFKYLFKLFVLRSEGQPFHKLEPLPDNIEILLTFSVSVSIKAIKRDLEKSPPFPQYF